MEALEGHCKDFDFNMSEIHTWMRPLWKIFSR